MDIKYLFLIITSILFLSCSSKQKSQFVQEIKLIADTTFTEFNDSTLVSNRIVSMDALENELYLSDYSSGIIVLNENLKIIKKIGSRGQGPGEFLGAMHCCFINSDSMLIINDGKHCLELFVKGAYIKQIPFPKEVSLTGGTLLFFHEYIYHSIISDKQPIAVFDYNSEVKALIGQYTKWDNPELKLHSARHVIKGEHCFFAIGVTLPIFQKYDFDGKLLSEYDMEQIPLVQSEMKRYKTEKQIPNTYFIMVQDVYYKDDKVYLLISDNNVRYSCNTICVLDISDQIKHIQTWKLPHDIYESFCIFGKKIVAFNASDARIDVFSLPDQKKQK